MAQRGGLEYHKVEHVIHADNIIVDWARPLSLLDPEQVLLRKESTHHELDAFHVPQLVLVVGHDILLPQFFVVGLFLIKLAFVEHLHDPLLNVGLVILSNHISQLGLSQVSISV